MFLNIFKKKPKQHITYSESFRLVMECANNYMENKSRDEQLILLDYIINSLKIDLCATGTVFPWYNQPTEPFNPPFPSRVYDEKENEIEIFGAKTEVSLESSSIYVRPWNNNRAFDSIIYLSNKDFIYDKDNHGSYYYDDIDLCYVYNGNHSINAGRYYKKGKISSVTCNMVKLYEHCYTDGLNWYNAHTNQVIATVEDFRLAAIFEIAKKRYNLRNEDVENLHKKNTQFQ